MPNPRILALGGAALILSAAIAATVMGDGGGQVHAVSGPARVVDERTLQIGDGTARLWGLEPLERTNNARDTLHALVDGKRVWCMPITAGEQAPMRCFIDNENIAVLLLARGEGRTPGTLRGGEKDWVKAYKTAEAHAQHAHLGVWQE